jgi:hypothetical protein
MGWTMKWHTEQRCDKCGMWLADDCKGHGSFLRLASGGLMCPGQPTGRKRKRLQCSVAVLTQRGEWIETSYLGSVKDVSEAARFAASDPLTKNRKWAIV